MEGTESSYTGERLGRGAAGGAIVAQASVQKKPIKKILPAFPPLHPSTITEAHDAGGWGASQGRTHRNMGCVWRRCFLEPRKIKTAVGKFAAFRLSLCYPGPCQRVCPPTECARRVSSASNEVASLVCVSGRPWGRAWAPPTLSPARAQRRSRSGELLVFGPLACSPHGWCVGATL